MHVLRQYDVHVSRPLVLVLDFHNSQIGKGISHFPSSRTGQAHHQRLPQEPCRLAVLGPSIAPPSGQSCRGLHGSNPNIKVPAAWPTPTSDKEGPMCS